ncbi:MAG: carbon-monoxide dehydrogenase small subunit [Myxococcota bacterium]|jgi:carbon-monoxide dehydrogenase small subunit
MKIEHTIDGRSVSAESHPGELLVDYLRRSGKFSVKRGCQDGNCGTCVVIVDGEAVNSCLMMSHQTAGSDIETCEGIGNPRNPHPIQQAYVDNAAVQCGFCTPGLIMSTKALFDKNPNATEQDIRNALDGNICRCTGYVKIFDAVRDAQARLLAQGESA